MKTTLELPDGLLEQAKRHAKRTGQPLRALVEQGLRQVLTAKPKGAAYRLPDCSVGDPREPNPLEAFSWQDLRDLIYSPK